MASVTFTLLSSGFQFQKPPTFIKNISFVTDYNLDPNTGSIFFTSQNNVYNQLNASDIITVVQNGISTVLSGNYNQIFSYLTTNFFAPNISTTNSPNINGYRPASAGNGNGVSGYSGYSGQNGGSSGTGSSGTSGFSGKSGYSGGNGTSGSSGVSGFSGASVSGVSGANGASGTSGFSGINGAASGTPGSSGVSGFSGSNGSSGVSGFSGSNGTIGTSGFSGASGSGGGGASFPTQQVHTTGATVTISNQTTDIWFIVNPSSTLASLAITYPGTIVDGQTITVSTGGTLTSGVVVTSLTLNANTGHSFLQVSAPTSLQAGESFAFRYKSSNTILYRL